MTYTRHVQAKLLLDMMAVTHESADTPFADGLANDVTTIVLPVAAAFPDLRPQIGFFSFFLGVSSFAVNMCFSAPF